MKFCRNCGTVMQAPAAGLPPTPMMPGPMPGASPMGGYGQPPQGGFNQPPPQQGFGGFPPPAPQGFGPPPQQGGFGMPQPPPPQPIPAPHPAGQTAGQAAAGAMPSACPRCGAPTQHGFAFCQQCGTKLTPQGGPTAGPTPTPGIDAHGATLAASGPIAEAVRAGALAPPRSVSAAAAGLAPTPAATGGWGSAVSVNRDGSDGERFPLAGEYVVIGRAGADIAFEQDRFLGRQHARIEPTTDGAARVVPLDTLNGVFRKIDAPTELVDGAIVLAGREVLRYEKVDADERAPTPLIRHGVALFGSPPREPWGRLLQMLPSGGVRDVRHLWEDEVVIGREDGDLVFSDDQFLSRRHATFNWDGAKAYLNDLGSSNGTFIRIHVPTALKHGEHLRMGDQLFRIELRR